LQGCCSQSSLNSNGSLPGAGSLRGVSEQRVASWAACFERLLQDPVGVRYFSVRKPKKFPIMDPIVFLNFFLPEVWLSVSVPQISDFKSKTKAAVIVSAR